jgi:hypothetical protein
MSINPVRAILQIVEARLANGTSRPEQAPAPTETKNNDPNTGNPPKPEIQEAQNAPASAELPQDEVDVQRDTQTNGDVVVKYKDPSGNLILQVPSTQVLGVARAITQDFRTEAKARETTAQTEDKGGNSDGH